MREFQNEAPTDFGREENARRMREAISRVEADLGREIPLVIGGERIQTKDRVVSVNPCRPAEVVGRAAKADRDLAGRAIGAAAEAFPAWSRTQPEDRAQILFRAAEVLRRRRLDLAAWLIVEVSKSWVEADADVAEAIDFLEFYGREMLRLAGPQPVTPVPGEKNALHYVPLGVGVVVAPWNFPLAILAGMASAAVVTGNTVVMKPASAAPVIAHRFAEAMEEAGLPRGVVNYLPCGGGEVGDFLVDHPQTRFVTFTGSKEIGVRIYERASRVAPGQKWLKRVVAEMGGKDAILVDEEADVEAAAEGVAAGAFGFQGQKCSACSRAIVHERVYDRFVDLLRKRTEAIRVGDVREPGISMGAVIDQTAYEKILGYIEVGRGEGRLVTGGGPAKEAGPGWFIRPTVFADVAPRARIAQEEIFGPVLAVIKARDFDEGLAIANDTEYGLTGSVYTRNRERLDRAAREFHVGNLYLNRKCTGALVGAHPFGGFNMSGTDSKAGGRDYLLLFLQGKAVSEKVQD